MLTEQAVKSSPEVNSKSSFSPAVCQVSPWFGFLSLIQSCVDIETTAACWSPFQISSYEAYQYQYTITNDRCLLKELILPQVKLLYLKNASSLFYVDSFELDFVLMESVVVKALGCNSNV